MMSEGRTYDLLRKSVLGILRLGLENTIWRFIISAQSPSRDRRVEVLWPPLPIVVLFG